MQTKNSHFFTDDKGKYLPESVSLNNFIAEVDFKCKS